MGYLDSKTYRFKAKDISNLVLSNYLVMKNSKSKILLILLKLALSQGLGEVSLSKSAVCMSVVYKRAKVATQTMSPRRSKIFLNTNPLTSLILASIIKR